MMNFCQYEDLLLRKALSVFVLEYTGRGKVLILKGFKNPLPPFYPPSRMKYAIGGLQL